MTLSVAIPYFCFYLVKNISCFQNQLKINQSRGIFIFHFVRADHFSVPGECSACICGESEEELKKESARKV